MKVQMVIGRHFGGHPLFIHANINIKELSCGRLKSQVNAVVRVDLVGCFFKLLESPPSCVQMPYISSTYRTDTRSIFSVSCSSRCWHNLHLSESQR